MAASNAANAAALAGNERRIEGPNPRVNPLQPCWLYMYFAASIQRGNFFCDLMGLSVMIVCLMTSEGYANTQKTVAASPPDQKLMDGVDIFVLSSNHLVKISYEPHQNTKFVLKIMVESNPLYIPRIPEVLYNLVATSIGPEYILDFASY